MRFKYFCKKYCDFVDKFPWEQLELIIKSNLVTTIPLCKLNPKALLLVRES